MTRESKTIVWDLHFSRPAPRLHLNGRGPNRIPVPIGPSVVVYPPILLHPGSAHQETVAGLVIVETVKADTYMIRLRVAIPPHQQPCDLIWL